MSPPLRDPSPPVTLFCIPNDRWITPRCPRVTFTSPADRLRRADEAELLSRWGVACDCLGGALEAVPRALVARDTRGVVKLVAEAGTGRIRGAHVVADGAGEVITAAGLQRSAPQMNVTDLAGTWAPY